MSAQNKNQICLCPIKSGLNFITLYHNSVVNRRRHDISDNLLYAEACYQVSKKYIHV
jgi:hypothetical protein